MNILWVVAFLLYFLPGIWAYVKKVPHRSAILLLNIFLGWTFVGWVVALVWTAVQEANVRKNKES